MMTGLKSVYTSSNPIKFLTADMAKRTLYFATYIDIYSLHIDMQNPSAEFVVSSKKLYITGTEKITNTSCLMLLIITCFHIYSQLS